MTHSKLLAQQTLETLTDILQTYDQELFDLDCDDLKLQLSFESKGTLLINYHQTTEQLWVSSPVSGAHHFALQDKTWICTRSGRSFIDFLNQELHLLTGENINLNVA